MNIIVLVARNHTRSKDWWLASTQQTKRNSCQEKYCNKMSRTLTTVHAPGDAEVWNRIIEGGRVLASLIGKEFPVADKVWPEINKFQQMINGYGLKDTWVTMIALEDQEVRNVVMAFCLSFLLLLILYLVDCVAGNH